MSAPRVIRGSLFRGRKERRANAGKALRASPESVGRKVSRAGREGTLKMPAEASCSAAALAPKVRGECRESGRKGRKASPEGREQALSMI